MVKTCNIEVENGYATQGVEVGDLVTVTCKYGYKLRGSRFGECQTDALSTCKSIYLLGTHLDNYYKANGISLSVW